MRSYAPVATIRISGAVRHERTLFTLTRALTVTVTLHSWHGTHSLPEFLQSLQLCIVPRINHLQCSTARTGRVKERTTPVTSAKARRTD
ncbi:hypothetical protein J6590_044879 [Homalodisca vitripennis]|nr:hypothetical protein J6590_044879 [Homalodisca vitripennis]